ncbi:SGNH/GDSL hydrolase family protein [Ottowia testudinis]|uniref:Phospholipase/lecithinase/hemolysin n=1 Tax=Ottowia testudinis TaxID=2816950 RepID=A0A975H4U5_9BURK|nr:SGNH/GDSL hydrolase family protein [Ottowia testudinis]QTD46740.1 hypothetical protein J1M35_07670 [Ottowia testudinis]
MTKVLVQRQSVGRVSRGLAALAVLGSALSACGNAGVPDEAVNPKGFTTLKVFGDDMSDMGAYDGRPGYGRSFTIMGNNTMPVWLEGLAQIGLRVPVPCSHYRQTDAGFQTTPTCSDFAVGGARIAQTPGHAPPAVAAQLAHAATAQPPQAKDLYLLHAGTNDLLDLVSAYLQRQAAPEAWRTLLQTQLGAAEATAAGASAAAADAALLKCTQQLGTQLYDHMQRQALDKGARYVALITVPDISLLPRVQRWIAHTAAGNAAQQQALTTLFRNGTGAFNQALTARAAGDARITVVDWSGFLTAAIGNPKYAISHATTPACPPVGADAMGSSRYDLKSCTFDALSARAAWPAGATSSLWWIKYLFADDVHYTTHGHYLLREATEIALGRAGWSLHMPQR